MYHKIFAAVVAVCSLLQTLSAQETPGFKVELRFLAFSNAIKEKEVFAQDPAAPNDAPSSPCTIKSYLNHQFSTISLKSRKVIFTKNSARDSIGRQGEVVGEVNLPEGADSFVLLFLPGKPGANALYQIMAIPDSKRAFPAGSFHITNLSPLPIRLMLEDKNFDFKPGQLILIDNPPMRPEGQCGMKAFAFKDEKWSAVSTGLWPSPGESRSLMIFFANPVSGNLQLQSFDDVPPRVAKPQNPAGTAP